MSNKKNHKKEDDAENALYLVSYIISFIIIVWLSCYIGGACTQIGGGSRYNDEWDYIQHQVDNDPYFKQWD